MFVDSETQLVEMALDLEQKGTTRDRARARAVRGVTMPMRNHLIAELPHWQRSRDDMAHSITATMEVLGSMLASISFSTTIGGTRQARLEVLNLALRALQDSAYREESKAAEMLAQRGES